MEKAKKLLTMSNYDGKPIVILGDLSSGIRGMGLAIQSQLKALGITAKLDLMERASMAQKRKGNEWDIHLVPFRAAYPIPDVYAGWTGTNRWIGKWDDEDSHRIDKMFDDLARTTNHEERFRMFEKIQGFHADIVPIIKLGEANRLQILHKRLKGFESATMPAFFNVWLDK
jgi:ABC-type transport system substrate-binding protein